MMCRICEITHVKLKQAIELILLERKGSYIKSDFQELAEAFPEEASSIGKLDQQDCDIHYNFHQQMVRTPAKGTDKSLSADINKDEAEVLSELLNSQMATFTALSKQINEGIVNRERDMTAMLINPSTAQFYKELGDSVRLTVKELRELNVTINGQHDSSLEGLTALVSALKGSEPKELSTTEYD